MNLDRNINESGKGKYALINLRKIPSDPRTPEELATAILLNPECVEFGMVGDPDEFFVIKLKDRFSRAALSAYARVVELDTEGDKEYLVDLLDLADRSGSAHPLCKRPD